MKRKLRNATLAGGYLQRFTVAFPTSLTIVLFSPRGEVMGWAFAHRHGNLPTDFSLFINRRFRRQGIGALLVKEGLKDFKKIRLAEWNETTGSLFHKLRRQHPTQIAVFDWWEERGRYDKFVDAAMKHIKAP